MTKKIGKFGFLKNGAGIGENAYQVRYGSLRPDFFFHFIVLFCFCIRFAILMKINK